MHQRNASRNAGLRTSLVLFAMKLGSVGTRNTNERRQGRDRRFRPVPIKRQLTE
jgi:hypothetical protein